jgi:O-antigen/teichoic acid export membrane protein
MSSAKVIGRNLAFNWFSQGANLIVMFFLSPFVIHSLGLAAYGLWGVLNVLTGYMGVLDLGVRASTGRYIILNIGKGDTRAVDKTIRTSLGFFSFISLVFIAAGFLIGLAFPKLFTNVSQEFYPIMPILMPLMALNVWFGTYGSVMSSVLIAHDRFDLARSVDMAVLAVRTVGTVFVLKSGYGLMGLVAVTVCCNLLSLLGNWLIARKIYPDLRVWPLMLDRTCLKELFSYGILAAISSASVKVMGQTDLIIVVAMIGDFETGIYSAGASLLYYSSTFLGQIRSTFFPPVQRAVARNEMGQARWLFFRQIHLSMFLTIPIFVGFICFGRQFLYLWVYDPVLFPDQAIFAAAAVMGLLAASKLLLLFTSSAQGLLDAMGLVRYNARISVVEAIVNILLSVTFVASGWGLAGVAMGTLSGRFLVRTFPMSYLACRAAGISWGKMFKNIFWKLSFTGALFAVICFAVQHFFPGGSWAMFALQVAVSLILYLFVAFPVLVPAADRAKVISFARGKTCVT